MPITGESSFRVSDPRGEWFSVQVDSGSGGRGPAFIYIPGAPRVIRRLLVPLNGLLRARQQSVRRHTFFMVHVIRERDERLMLDDDRHFETAEQAQTAADRVAAEIQAGAFNPDP